MCGIAGLAYRRAHDFRQEAERRVQTMIDVQAHRGPDGEGLWSTSIGATGVTLGQKRLAIQDLSSAGAQPMLSECGGYFAYDDQWTALREQARSLQAVAEKLRRTPKRRHSVLESAVLDVAGELHLRRSAMPSPQRGGLTLAWVDDE